jgi:hypothetical protein
MGVERAIYFKPINFFLKGTRKRIGKNTTTLWSAEFNIFPCLCNCKTDKNLFLYTLDILLDSYWISFSSNAWTLGLCIAAHLRLGYWMNRSFLGFAMSLPYAWERGISLQKLEKICSSNWMKGMGWKYVPVLWFSDTLSKRRERREHACERDRWRSSEHETRICDCGCGGKELDSDDFDDFHVISARFTQFFGYSKTHTHKQSSTL